jgi:SPP1 gp7 family putative phage head morphogenesis protein
VGRWYFFVKAFDPDKDLEPQLKRRIALEQERMEHRFKQGLDGYRQETLGIDQYIWRTQDDGKVRPLHRQYDDRVFSWDTPPADGHPGDAYNCRCLAEPVLPDVLPLDPDPPEISDEDWAALAQEMAATLLLTVLAAYTAGAATPLALARAAILARRVRGAYQAAARFIRTVKDPKTRESLEKRQEALQNAIKRVDEAVKRSEDRNAAEKIVRGHAWETHFAKGKELPDQVKTPQDLVKKIEETLKDPERVHNLKRNRILYLSKDKKTIVIGDELSKDSGTAFYSRDGEKRFFKIIEKDQME